MAYNPQPVLIIIDHYEPQMTHYLTMFFLTPHQSSLGFPSEKKRTFQASCVVEAMALRAVRSWNRLCMSLGGAGPFWPGEALGPSSLDMLWVIHIDYE